MKFIDTSNLLEILFEEQHTRNVNNKKNGEIKFNEFLKHLLENGEKYNDLSLEKKVSYSLRGFLKKSNLKGYKTLNTQTSSLLNSKSISRRENVSNFTNKSILNLPLPIFLTYNGSKNLVDLKKQFRKKFNTNNKANILKENLSNSIQILKTTKSSQLENQSLKNKKVFTKNFAFAIVNKSLTKTLKNLKIHKGFWKFIPNLVPLFHLSQNEVNKAKSINKNLQFPNGKIHKLSQLPNEEKLNKTYNVNQNSVLENLTRNLHNKITAKVKEISITKSDKNKENNNTFSGLNTNFNQFNFENLKKIKKLIGGNKIEKPENFGKYYKHFSLKIPLDENTKLQIKLVKNNFYAKIVSNSETANILVQNLPTLTQQLANLGFSKTVVQVQTAQNSSGKNNSKQNSQNSNNKHKNAEKVTPNSKDNNSGGFSFSFYL